MHLRVSDGATRLHEGTVDLIEGNWCEKSARLTAAQRAEALEVGRDMESMAAVHRFTIWWGRLGRRVELGFIACLDLCLFQIHLTTTTFFLISDLIR